MAESIKATIGPLMTRDLSFVSEDASIQKAAKHMHAKRIGSLLVKKETDFPGIVTETDVVQAVAEQPAEIEQLTVGLMPSPIMTVDPNMAPYYARDLMTDETMFLVACLRWLGKICKHRPGPWGHSNGERSVLHKTSLYPPSHRAFLASRTSYLPD